MFPDAVLDVRRRLVDRHVDRARRGVRVLAGVDREGLEAAGLVGHVLHFPWARNSSRSARVSTPTGRSPSATTTAERRRWRSGVRLVDRVHPWCRSGRRRAAAPSRRARAGSSSRRRGRPARAGRARARSRSGRRLRRRRRRRSRASARCRTGAACRSPRRRCRAGCDVPREPARSPPSATIASTTVATLAARAEHAVRAHPLVVEDLAEVARPPSGRITMTSSGPAVARHLERGVEREARRAADQDALLARAPRRVNWKESRSETVIQRSTTPGSNVVGQKSSPTPSTR